MFKFALLLSTVIAFAYARVRSCDRGVLGPDPVSIRISGCDPNAAGPCRIIRGSIIEGSMDFVARKSI